MQELYILIDATTGYIIKTRYTTPFPGGSGTVGVATNQLGVAFEPHNYKYDFDTNLFKQKREKYKIYELIDSTATYSHPNRTCPKTIDYKTSLTTSMYPYREFNSGFLNRVTWYGKHNMNHFDNESEGSFSEPVILVNVDYRVNVDDYTTGRTTTRKWYYADGTLPTDENEWKITEKNYNTEDAMREGVRRRGNIIVSLKKNTIGMIMLTESGTTVSDAEALGSNFFLENKDCVESYKEINHRSSNEIVPIKGLLDCITSASTTTHYWIDNDLTPIGMPGVTIADYMISNIDC